MSSQLMIVALTIYPILKGISTHHLEHCNINFGPLFCFCVDCLLVGALEPFFSPYLGRIISSDYFSRGVETTNQFMSLGVFEGFNNPNFGVKNGGFICTVMSDKKHEEVVVGC